MRMKKIVSWLCLVCIMVGMLSIPSFAADSTITLTGTDGDTYEAYQVFSAETRIVGGAERVVYTLNSDFNGFFTDAKISPYDTALDYVIAQSDASDAAQMAEQLMNYVTDNSLTPAASGTTSLEVNKGYYLIIEKENNVGARSLAMLEVSTREHEIAVKSSAPTFTFKVYDDDTDSYVDIADVAKNEVVKFKGTGTITTMQGYTNYVYNMHNKLEDGLTFVGIDSVKFYNGTGDEVTPTGVTYEAVASTAADYDFDIVFTGMKNAISSGATTVEVVYTVSVSDDVTYGNDGNMATAYLTYSNDPYNVGSTENTVADNVMVYSYTLDIAKEDAISKAKLEGAVFTLYSDSAATVPVYLLATGEANTYKVVNSGTAGAVTEITTDTDGMLYIEGLDATSYYLKEISAPFGYNPIVGTLTITIGAEYDGKDDSFALSDRAGLATISSNYKVTSTGALIEVENSVGGTLPQMGGQGDSTFKIVGIGSAVVGVCLIGAFIVLGNRKKEEDK